MSSAFFFSAFFLFWFGKRNQSNESDPFSPADTARLGSSSPFLSQSSDNDVAGTCPVIPVTPGLEAPKLPVLVLFLAFLFLSMIVFMYDCIG